ncbi:hypothetical protein DERF_000447 [Dermatophagoides farinae]|uniref:DMA domain-containing protein n=1 Tax=Dermatophagoides farinae TaxID=6954 RepID=A0A922IBJ3_DERFA|nr:hypothetical protein DERF_000447 [Dermatophagoides farinae]
MNVIKILEKIFPKINDHHLETTLNNCNGDILKTIDVLIQESSSQNDLTKFDTETMIQRMMTIKVPVETDFSEIRKKFGLNKKKPKNSFVRHKANYEKAMTIRGHNHHNHNQQQQQQQHEIVPIAKQLFETNSLGTGCLPLESSHFGTQDINQFMFNNGPEPLSFSTKQQHSPMTNNNLQLNPALMTNFNTDIHPRGIVDTNTIPSSIGGINLNDLSIFHPVPAPPPPPPPPQSSSSSSSSPATATAAAASSSFFSSNLAKLNMMDDGNNLPLPATPSSSSSSSSLQLPAMTRQIFDSLVGYRSLFGGSIPGFFPATPNLASSLHGLLPNGGNELTQQQPKTFQQQQQQQRTTPTTATTTTTMPTTQALSMNIHHQLQNALHNICASGIVAGNNGGWYGNMMMGATTSSTATSIMGTNNNNNNKNSTTGTMNITNVKTTNNTELD